MKHKIFFIFSFLWVFGNHLCCFAQSYSDLPIKEKYDRLHDAVLPDYALEAVIQTNGAPSNNLMNTIGDRASDLLLSQLRMFRATGDKGYLIKFINMSIKLQLLRNDRIEPGDHPGWVTFADTTNIYHDGYAASAMAEYVFMVKNNNTLYTTALPQNLIEIPNTIANVTTDPTILSSSDILTYGSFATWLGARVEETLDYFLNNNYWEDSKGFKHDNGGQPKPINGNPLSINMQAGFATALIYMGLTGNGNVNSKYYQYRVKAGIIANKYLSTQFFIDECTLQLFIEPVMNLYVDNSYWWYDKAWVEPSVQCFSSSNHDSYIEFIEDISHAIPVLKFPLAVYPNYLGLFNTTDMIRWRNTFTKRLFAGYSGNIPTFNESVLGSGTIGVDLDVSKNYSLAYMPFYQFDDDANETPYVYNIIMDFYKYDFQNQTIQPCSPSGNCPDLQGNQYYGLSEVVSAQWDKECPNLTLYNRDVVYDQDFFAKGELTIAPNQTADAYYTSTSFADPQITTQDFIVEDGVEANFSAGQRIVVKKGHIKNGARSRGFIDASLNDCGPGKWGGSSNSQDNSDNPIILPEEQTIEDDTALVQDSTQTIKKEIIISLHPNPTTGKFNLSIDDTKADKVLIVVVDMLGIERYSKVFVLKEDNYTLAIDPEGKLPAGVYMVIAASDNEIYRKKIVIQ